MKRKITLTISIGIIVSLIGASIVFASTQTRPITAEGTYTGGTYSGGGTYANLNSDDGDVSYIYHSATYAIHSWQFQDFLATDSINSVTVYSKARTTGAAASVKEFAYVGGNFYWGTNHSLTATYTTYSSVWATNPATGNPWTMAEVNAAEFGIQFGSAGVQEARVTYLYIEINYTATEPTSDTLDATGVGISAGSHIATLEGEVTDDGGADVTERGFAWGTTSNATTPASTEAPPATYTTNWTEGSADWGTGDFDHQITGLASCTTYYYRAYAYNAQGYGWGDEESFMTLCTPTITTVAASQVATTTARLNALVTSDGGQDADVRFAYGTNTANCTIAANCTATAACNATSYTTVTAWVEDSYGSGESAYVDLTGLTAGTTYYFCSQVRNDFTCTCGGELSFTTESGVGSPSDFEGIPDQTALSLVWVKGTGTTRTMVRYKLGATPTSATDGSLAYFDTQAAHRLTGLTPGTTYYLVAIGESGGVYSTTNATLMLTTLPMVSAGESFEVPPEPTNWFQAPDYTTMQNLPIYGFVNWAADCFGFPRATAWSFLVFLMAAAAGLGLYNVGERYNLVLGMGAATAVLVTGAFMSLISMWVMFIYLVGVSLYAIVANRF